MSILLDGPFVSRYRLSCSQGGTTLAAPGADLSDAAKAKKPANVQPAVIASSASLT
jgi:hypothetical protein